MKRSQLLPRVKRLAYLSFENAVRLHEHPPVEGRLMQSAVWARSSRDGVDDGDRTRDTWSHSPGVIHFRKHGQQDSRFRKRSGRVSVEGSRTIPAQ
jgi:hypothetical protein